MRRGAEDGMQQEQISFRDIRPFVRFAGDIYITGNWPHRTVNTCDHRLFYVVSGEGVVEIGGAASSISAGQVLCWMSGTAYRFAVDTGQAMHLISINFDYTQRNRENVQYLPVKRPQDYAEGDRLEALTFSDAPAMNAPVLLAELPEILPDLRSIVGEAERPALFSDLRASSLLTAVLSQLCRAASQRKPVRGQIDAYLQIAEYVNLHYAEALDNGALAVRFGYHPKYIAQLFTKHTGTSLHQYLLRVRLRNAIFLLQTTQLPVSEVARRVGFGSASYFSEYFRRCTGYSPSAFRVS